MERKTANSEHGPIAYTVTGDADGQVIVLLPGFQSDQTGWSSRGYHELLSDYRVLNVDPIGHGRSATPHDESAYTTDAVVGHVVSILDAEQVDSAHIWGFSRGGFIAGLCSELVAERCSSAIMGGTPLRATGAAPTTASEEMDRGVRCLADGDWAGYWASYVIPLPDAVKERFEKTNDPRANAAAIRAMRRWSTEVPGFGLNPTSVPRFVYFGSGEVFAGELRDALVGTDAKIFEGPWAGHAETMMDPEGVVAVVRSFLEGLPSEGTSV